MPAGELLELLDGIGVLREVDRVGRARALALDKGSTMVGVFISVTTVPAAGNLALGLAVGAESEIAGSAAQLGLNISTMIVAGVAVFALMRRFWLGVTRRSERIPGWGPHHAPR